MNIAHSLLAGALALGFAAPAYALPQNPIASPAQAQKRIVLGSTASRAFSYPADMPGTPDRKSLKEIDWRMAEVFGTSPSQDKGISIMGRAEATPEQMVDYIRKKNPKPKLTCSLEQLVAAYYEEAGRENIRPDVALCQAIKETGFFRYGNDVKPAQNNFCGLGAVGKRAGGASFATAQLGVRAHIQHIMAYASPQPPSTDIIDPRYAAVVKFRAQHAGKSQYWTDLNGVWAIPGKGYGESILRIWQAAKGDSSNTKAGAVDPALKSRYEQAFSLYQKKKYKDSIKELRELLAVVPSVHAPNLLNNLAIIEIQQKKYKEAWKDLHEAAQLAPTSTTILTNLERFDSCLKKKK